MLIEPANRIGFTTGNCKGNLFLCSVNGRRSNRFSVVGRIGKIVSGRLCRNIHHVIIYVRFEIRNSSALELQVFEFTGRIELRQARGERIRYILQIIMVCTNNQRCTTANTTVKENHRLLGIILVVSRYGKRLSTERQVNYLFLFRGDYPTANDLIGSIHVLVTNLFEDIFALKFRELVLYGIGTFVTILSRYDDLRLFGNRSALELNKL